MFFIGIFVHLVFLFSIFDIYFKSPIVNNAVTYQPLHEPPADRLVLFVVDGLRAESFVNYTTMPYLRNFLTTIKFVDENIKEIEQIIKDFYNDDGKTTFLMTSDHGMTDWGSHGTGDDDETKTPYVLWGAGVQTVQDNLKQLDPETVSMLLEHRYDINQADLTPLMSSFLSIPVPVNSVGQLPSGLLQMSLPNKAKAIYSNCRQMISQYNKKRLDVEASAISVLYQPFEPFDGKKVQEIISFTEKLLQDEQYEKVVKLSEEIMHLSLSGLNYYHNYYQKPLLFTVTLSFIGWIMCLLKFLIEQKMFAQTEMTRNKNYNLISTSKTADVIIKVFSVFASILLSLMIQVQGLPVQYHIYFLMPIFLWMYALTPVNLWIQTLYLLKNRRRIYLLGIEILCYTLGSMALGLALTHRWVLSVPLLGMGLWPFFAASIQSLPKWVWFAWPFGCVSLSIFSFMSVIGKDTYIELVVSAGIIWLLIHSLFIWRFLLSNSADQDAMRELIISIIQIFTLAASLQAIYVQSKRFEDHLPVSQTLQSMCWIISVLLPLIPLLYTKKFINRLLGINTAILNFYLLLSVAHEGLFMVTMILNVNCWMFIEFKLINLSNIKIDECTFEEDNSKREKHLACIDRSVSSQDFRRAFFFTLYIILAYFGTGNIASLNSFEIRWVLCFTTSFRPFIMTTLILLKTLSPFLSVACSFRAIQYLTKAPSGCLNIVVLIYSNIMGLHMLYHVRNTGSWLEIGTSISQYIIVQLITLFIVLINQIAKVLTEVEIHNSILTKLFKNRKKYV
ncbi:GPI ethanolamine phosphate transferase 1 isoform X2 [Bicyclus anynana]|uniref:GPI ethanolamine phosphate transferase 1 n=1 Tax=Bicyclus anynana TaxID=110368 RepID=A0ABM3LTR4_BICAN|nr:GPI ethanolamine phosphate transferase 1 isoform X2 [Bicyclus anynana]